MTGLEIFYSGKTIEVIPEYCDISIFIYNRNGLYYFQVTGLDENMMAYTWIDSWLGPDSEMKSGEAIEIEIKAIDKCSEPISKRIAFSESVKATEEEVKVINAERIERFYALEKILKDEGLLPE